MYFYGIIAVNNGYIMKLSPRTATPFLMFVKSLYVRFARNRIIKGSARRVPLCLSPARACIQSDLCAYNMVFIFSQNSSGERARFHFTSARPPCRAAVIKF